MIYPNSLEEITNYENSGRVVFFFTATWCGDCQFIKPFMPEIESEFADYQFVEIDRDKFIDTAIKWDIFGIPSFIVIQDGKEVGRLVNKNRKTKEDIAKFLKSIG
ncbi:thioredoxin family protein [Melissococcus plutonius]|uniref:Thioredoxin n=2 Tax=Melissococcus plutonius TaxID=33970 RepID=F3Y7Y9_MELPT|nr:thioredoxin family protein [Melissococcus plutonius]BAL61415.1 thioredoxin [Melissococcus plutonius DAT561]AIM24371.1 thioredoxin-like protein YtpP [Melissococcus plutonius S1]KMT25761.1 thioredoxin-like protein YtpP [Melissococcus plutonius]KMT27106.1 thioredoxin-like protein YtpP [Melissococcus plutonius]KMT28207.1 thioredoxin-like protein YtpP [Melissococcus plutonius]